MDSKSSQSICIDLRQEVKDLFSQINCKLIPQYNVANLNNTTANGQITQGIKDNQKILNVLKNNEKVRRSSDNTDLMNKCYSLSTIQDEKPSKDTNGSKQKAQSGTPCKQQYKSNHVDLTTKPRAATKKSDYLNSKPKGKIMNNF